MQPGWRTDPVRRQRQRIKERIDRTYEGLMADSEGFLIDLVGSEEEGLKQIFSEPTRHMLLVNEYIHRYGRAAFRSALECYR